MGEIHRAWLGLVALLTGAVCVSRQRREAVMIRVRAW